MNSAGGQADEADRVRRAIAGDRSAFAALVQRYQKPLVNFAYRYLGQREDAEDVAQDAFVRAYLSLKDLRNPEAFAGYLFKIALNLARKGTARLRRPDERVLEAVPSAEASAITHLECEQVARAVAGLPEEYRLPVSLHVRDGLSFGEIGDLIGASEGACRMRYHRARQMLRARLGVTEEAETT